MIFRNLKHSVLFVCTANQCRSPMAEALFQHLLEEKKDDKVKWKVESAGCWAYPGLPATGKALQTVNEMGCSLIHSSKLVTEKLLRKFNLILCMETDHKQYIQQHFSFAANKTFLLSEMINKNNEIDDPVGKSLEEYQITADKINSILQDGFVKIKELST